MTISVLCLWIVVSLHTVYGSGKSLFVFDHLAKTGGTETEKCLNIAFGKAQMILHTAEVDKLHPDEHLKSMLRSNSFITDMASKGNVNNNWIVVKELDGIGQLEARKESFVIGGIREPCSLYTSMWAYRSNAYDTYKNKNLSVNWWGMEKPYFGRDKGYGTVGDLKRFEQWMEYIAVKNAKPLFTVSKDKKLIKQNGGGGIMSVHFMLSYLTQSQDFSLHDIDCWVREENLHNDLKLCFERYMMQGGVIPYYHKYLQYINSDDKNHNSNPSSHKECSFYYNKTTAARVEKADEFIYKLFNIKGCCNPNYEIPV